jgi:aminoglycoside phosphotransferase (APT) family kinase protein
VAKTLDIEQAETLIRHLRETGRIEATETPICQPLEGGVSNRTVRVDRPSGESWVLKQALPKLRVAQDWFSNIVRVHREALGLRWLERLAPPGAVPAFLFEDHHHHFFAMRAVAHPHENWKTRLLRGCVDADVVREFGTLLGLIHRRAFEQSQEVAQAFGDREFFESLRLEPYYRFTATQHPEAVAFLNGLVEETLSTRLTLVHGDYSPKNILIHQRKLVLLDHEVIHFGDPTFDLGFALAHFLSKARHLPEHRRSFLNAASEFWVSYREAAGGLSALAGFTSRAVRQTLGCLLARVSGRSPLEYLTARERQEQRAAVLLLMERPPADLEEFLCALAVALGRHAS